MKKFLACVLSASMMLGLLAGCAGAGSSSGNAPAGSGAAVSTPAVSGDNVLKIGVFEPSTGDSASGGKKEMLGMQYANSETPTVTVGGQEYQIQLVYADNGSSTDKALTAATQLVSEGVSGAGLLRLRRVHRRRPHLRQRGAACHRRHLHQPHGHRRQ